MLHIVMGSGDLQISSYEIWNKLHKECPHEKNGLYELWMLYKAVSLMNCGKISKQQFAEVMNNVVTF